MNVVIPMAGAGKRFKEHGFTLPKPLIDVLGKPMIDWVVKNVIDVLPKDHSESSVTFLSNLETRSFGLEEHLLQNKDLCDVTFRVVYVDKLTQGAACTVLLAEEFIDNDDELFIFNSDQFVEFSHDNFALIKGLASPDGIIFTFKSSEQKWSYAILSGNDAPFKRVVETVEKVPVSDIATCGIYYFRKGSDFVSSAKKMIEKNVRTNNEFYVCPVYNQMIDPFSETSIVLPFFVDKMHGLGTPEDLKNFVMRNSQLTRQ